MHPESVNRSTGENCSGLSYDVVANGSTESLRDSTRPTRMGRPWTYREPRELRYPHGGMGCVAVEPARSDCY